MQAHLGRVLHFGVDAELLSDAVADEVCECFCQRRLPSKGGRAEVLAIFVLEHLGTYAPDAGTTARALLPLGLMLFAGQGSSSDPDDAGIGLAELPIMRECLAEAATGAMTRTEMQAVLELGRAAIEQEGAIPPWIDCWILLSVLVEGRHAGCRLQPLRMLPLASESRLLAESAPPDLGHDIEGRIGLVIRRFFGAAALGEMIAKALREAVCDS